MNANIQPLSESETQAVEALRCDSAVRTKADPESIREGFRKVMEKTPDPYAESVRRAMALPGTGKCCGAPPATGLAPEAAHDGPALSKPPLAYKDCSNESWCEYRYIDAQGVPRAYRIDSPVKMFFYKGCTTHRVLDAAGLVHIVPAISQGGCVRVYMPRDAAVPVLG